MTFETTKFLWIAGALAFSLLSILLLGVTAIFFAATKQSFCFCSEAGDSRYLQQLFLMFVGLVCTLPFAIAIWAIQQWNAFMAKPRSSDETRSTPRSVLQSLAQRTRSMYEQ
jgi:hypothetical protein